MYYTDILKNNFVNQKESTLNQIEMNPPTTISPLFKKGNINQKNESFNMILSKEEENSYQSSKLNYYPSTPKKEVIGKENKISSPEKDINFNNYQILFQTNSIDPKHYCTCSKTKCLKKYCECLANNQFCNNCNCVDCHNNPIYQQENLKDDKDLSTCTCTKSNCNKKYCECYKVGEKCNNNCRCINCFNKNQCLIKKYKMERISVLIEEMKIFIEKKQILPFSDNNDNKDNNENNDDDINNEQFLTKKTDREN